LSNRKLPYLAGHSPREILFGVSAVALSDGKPNYALRLASTDLLHREVEHAYTEEQENRRQRHKEWNAYEPMIGDLVVLYDPADDHSFTAADKLKPKWSGPFRVVSNTRRSSRLSTLDDRPRQGRVGWQRLKRWKLESDE
jgi:hypothetical protein